MISHFWDCFIANLTFLFLFNRRLPLEDDNLPACEHEISGVTTDQPTRSRLGLPEVAILH